MKSVSGGVQGGPVPRASDPYIAPSEHPGQSTRQREIAAFLVRATGYVDGGGGDLFVDDDGSVFESAIDRLATAGVTKGCNPPVNNRFCSDQPLTRAQVAAFLKRALE